jgi:hypothetical protein
MVAIERPPSSPPQRTNPLAIAALVCGIVQFCGLPPAGIVAIILGHKAERQIRQTGEYGHGPAKVGLILGYIGIALVIAGLVVLLLFSSAGPLGPRGIPVGH